MIDRDAELFEHLQELRTRLVRSVVYLVIGVTIAWFIYDPVFNLLTAPVKNALREHHLPSGMIMTRMTEAFMLRCQVSVIAGAILASPGVTMEIWGFIAPALTLRERRPIKWIAPLCVLLFALGVCVGYAILPAAMRYFVQFIPDNTNMLPVVSDNLVFIIKMLLAFGIVFEMPIVLLFLGKVGIVNARMLAKGWRHAMVAIAVIAAVATPSNDAISMLAMAVPLAGLYFLSIFLVKLVEGKRVEG